MKSFLSFFLITAGLQLHAQKQILVTESFTIEGKVKKVVAVSLAELPSYEIHSVDSIVIKNHLNETKNTLKNVKAVLLKDILEKVEIDVQNPKLLSEYYFNCIAADNYKVVFSWNEIFNTDLGKSIYILIGNDGRPTSALDDRIALISKYDHATGRRYVKGLKKIVVGRVE